MAEQRLIDANAILYVEAVDGDTYEGTGKLYARKKDIDALPTIEERKTGEWIKMSDADGYYYCCNKCGEELPRYTTELPSWDKPYPHKQSIDKTDFCPNCGADMRGEDHGQDD